MSNRRIQKFLNSDEIDEYVVSKSTIDTEGNILTIVNGSFKWSNTNDDPLVLKKCVKRMEIIGK